MGRQRKNVGVGTPSGRTYEYTALFRWRASPITLCFDAVSDADAKEVLRVFVADPSLWRCTRKVKG
jgi:hypothetical protein